VRVWLGGRTELICTPVWPDTLYPTTLACVLAPHYRAGYSQDERLHCYSK
jgi:hypothetical protein